MDGRTFKVHVMHKGDQLLGTVPELDVQVRAPDRKSLSESIVREIAAKRTLAALGGFTLRYEGLDGHWTEDIETSTHTISGAHGVMGTLETPSRNWTGAMDERKPTGAWPGFVDRSASAARPGSVAPKATRVRQDRREPGVSRVRPAGRTRN
jgi:hypothetical protein